MYLMGPAGVSGMPRCGMPPAGTCDAAALADDERLPPIPSLLP